MDLIAEACETSQFVNKLVGFLRQMIDCGTTVLFEYVHAKKPQWRPIDAITAMQNEFAKWLKSIFSLFNVTVSSCHLSKRNTSVYLKFLSTD